MAGLFIEAQPFSYYFYHFQSRDLQILVPLYIQIHIYYTKP